MFALLFLSAPVLAFAQGLLPCTGLDCQLTDLFKLLGTLFNYAIGLSALVLMAMLVWGGARMAYHSFLENAPSELKSAQETVTRSISGFVIILLAYVLVNTVVFLLTGQTLSAFFNSLIPGVGLF